jgi:tetratricopeptide (TPR) repeat protein
MTTAYRRLDNQYGGGSSRTLVSNYLTSNVEPLLRNGIGADNVTSELYSATAELYQLAGWIDYDTGHQKEGNKHLRTALKLCQDAGNDALAGEMLAGMSHQAAFHRSADTAVDLALAARQTAKNTGIGALQAEAAVLEAHGLALQGDKRGGIIALREAEIAFAAGNNADTPVWLSYFDEAYLAAKFSHTLRALGDFEQAEAFARRSLEMSEGYERGRLFNTALLASILAQRKKIDESCALGSLAVQMLGSVRSTRTVEYLADVGRALAPYKAAPVVRQFYRQLADAGIDTPER